MRVFHVKCGAVVFLWGAGLVFSQEPPRARLAEPSVDILVAGGTSSEENEGIERLQAGGHDPKRRGFTLQQAELSLSGAVDPFFSGEAHVVFTEDETELEEAFVRSTSLPGGLELKAGYYLTEFGRLNPTHPHSWPWMDQPVIASRLLGGDGTRGSGARLACLMPTPWYSVLTVGAQNADNESMVSFLGESGHHHGGGHGDDPEPPYEETVAGRPRVRDESDDLLYSLRWEAAFDLNDSMNALLGASGLWGPNAAGEDTQTSIYGLDLTVKWKPARNERGYPFVTWQTEFMKRRYESDSVEVALEERSLDLPGATLKDWGLYSQVLWGFRPQWEAGLRVDYATGDGEGPEPRAGDSMRDDRWRLSPLVQYRATEFSRFRLQYNYDDADHLDDGRAHTVWAGMELLFGQHPAHGY